MTYKNFVEEYAGKDIFNLCTDVVINREALTEEQKERLIDWCGHVPSIIKRQQVEDLDLYDIGEDVLDDDELYNMLRQSIKYSPYYLVYAYGVRWNGADGYMFAGDIRDAFVRDYDCEFLYDRSVKNGKGLVVTEYSHDCPTGSAVVIVGLTEKQKRLLEDAEFYEVSQFAEQYGA
ncbi:MAG TPA: hypothetical protein DEP00_06225 [Lachnospiraceae bacterium]|nr:hypothetical protein [Lachnospiraceae bacterium]